MKYSIFLVIFIYAVFNSNAQLEINGRYQKKNIFVQNPTVDQDNCVINIAVNGQPVDADFKHSAFEIKLTELNLEVGQEISIKIEHQIDCSPKILNPDDILPKSTFELLKMKVDADGTLKWTTKGEKGALVYQIQVYRWNKWLNIGKVMGTGKQGPNNYKFSIKPHAGENKVRILQVDYSGNERKSPEKTFESEIKHIDLSPSKEKCVITFYSEEQPIDTHYELYDKFGNLIKKGFAKQVNCKNLSKGEYHINFDNTKAELIKDKLMKVKASNEKENEQN